MTIIQELPSVDGTLKRAYIKDIVAVMKIDNYLIANKLHWVIMCTLAHSASYPIGYFPSRDLRDKALSYIERSSDKHVITLDYNQYWSVPQILDNEAKIILYKKEQELFTALRYAVEVIMSQKKLVNDKELSKLDAFAAAPYTILNNIRLGISMPIINLNLANIWARTLTSPKLLHSWGLGKAQYWRQLIYMNNENFNNVSTHSSTIIEFGV